MGKHEVPPLSVEEREIARALWSDGKSARQIAFAIGRGVTRNTIIGLEHRHRWTRAGQEPRPIPEKRSARSNFAPKPRERVVETCQPKPEVAMDLEPEAYQPTISFFPPPGAAKSVFDLKSNQCRFPIGDPASFEFRFCCKPTPTDREPRYCNECLKKATIPRAKAA